jgi:hypothetical protein
MITAVGYCCGQREEREAIICVKRDYSMLEEMFLVFQMNDDIANPGSLLSGDIRTIPKEICPSQNRRKSDD